MFVPPISSEGAQWLARTQPVTPSQVNALLRYNEVPLDEAAAERVRMLEVQTTDEAGLES